MLAGSGEIFSGGARTHWQDIDFITMNMDSGFIASQLTLQAINHHAKKAPARRCDAQAYQRTTAQLGLVHPASAPDPKNQGP
jgi:hypothetical protein